MKAKRLFDLVFTVPGFLILSPLFVVLALAIKMDSRGPVFFRQERVGRKGTPFRVAKLRSMRVDAERVGTQLTVGKDRRITRVGGFLRKTKLDELPQLYNVLAGDMSLVGPRPEVPRYVAMYSDAQRAVLDLVPGITDPASIKYSDENDLLAASPDPERTYVEEIMPEKIRLNLDYAARATLAGDFRVVIETLKRVFF